MPESHFLTGCHHWQLQRPALPPVLPVQVSYLLFLILRYFLFRSQLLHFVFSEYCNNSYNYTASSNKCKQNNKTHDQIHKFYCICRHIFCRNQDRDRFMFNRSIFICTAVRQNNTAATDTPSIFLNFIILLFLLLLFSFADHSSCLKIQKTDFIIRPRPTVHKKNITSLLF